MPEDTPTRPKDLNLSAKTNWQSPPFKVEFAAVDYQVRPDLPLAQPPSRLVGLLKSKLVVATFVILAAGIVLISRYGIPQFLLPPAQDPIAGSPAGRRQTAYFEQQREAEDRQQRDARRQQQRAVAVPVKR
jgi:hypothetical protein